jgi:PD-(D/E)XK nuclease superfamily
MADAKRDRWGRYLIIQGGGPAKPYTRATTVASAPSDGFGITKWKLRTLAVGLATRDDIYARIAATDPTDKKVLNALCEDALEAGRSSAGANYGTALHEAVARLNRGEQVTMPAPWQQDLDAYTQTITDSQITVLPRYVEQICVLDDMQIAGTFDLIVKLPDGTLAVADLKTGQSLEYSWHEIAIQLALYAHASDIYNPENGFREPMPDVRTDLALVIHLPAGQNSCALHTVDIAQGWDAAQLAVAVREWRARKLLSKAFTHDGPAVATPSEREALKRRVAALRELGHLDELATRWPADVPGFKNAHVHTVVELAAVARVVSEVEQLVGAPF